jgi:hypothetical protein
MGDVQPAGAILNRCRVAAALGDRIVVKVTLYDASLTI